MLQDKTCCLDRESEFIQSNTMLRKNRRALLADLTSFVKVTKGLECLLNNVSQDQVVELDLDDMVMKAFKVVTRAVKFIDIWEAHMHSIDVEADVPKNMHVPPTPPADRQEFGNLANDHHLAVTAPSDSDAQANNESSWSYQEQTPHRPRYNRSSQTFIRPGSSGSSRQSDRPPSEHDFRRNASHRISYRAHPGSPNVASEKLSALQNNFLTTLGYFIGLHIQSRSSSEILLTTKASVISCRDMLELVGEVWERDWRRSKALQEARDNLYKSIADLAEAARAIFKPLRSGEDDEIVMSSEGKPLIEAATSCVRAAGECVDESRFIIERIGDYDCEPWGLGISDIHLDHSNTPVPDTESLGVVEEEQHTGAVEESPVSPSPLYGPALQPSEFHDGVAPVAVPMSPATNSPITSSSVTPVQATAAPYQPSAEALLPPFTPSSSSFTSLEERPPSPPTSSISNEGTSVGHVRTDSLDVSSTGDSSTYIGSMRDSESSAVSQTSTRATSPDAASVNGVGMSSAPYADNEDDEVKIQERTFAHELVYNKEGQITGGTLPALIERLTTHDSTPDATFVSTFYLTFRLFATPTAFAQALIDRYQYVGESPRIAGPVRLRVYNVFKGWLESHWRNDCDTSALDLVLSFAIRQLQIVLPTAGKRLASLAEKVTASDGPLVPRLISSMGKTNTSIALYISPDTPLPAPFITKSQLAALREWKDGGANISILDFDPLELARQFTLKQSQIFCSILPEELLATEWTKKSGSMAVNVRAMSRLSTDLANLVADCILQLEDPKKRAVIIKQWVKIANKSLELANYDSLMAIICSLESSTILRLKRTWELVSSKTKATLEHLKSVVAISKNYAALRQQLQNQVPPCLPFLGTYLTDLTFIDVGNQTTRQLPGDGVEESKSVINFDKHMKTAKIISELQRFQIPYRFTEVPELQTWMQDQLVRVRTSDESNVQSYYRRSLLLEPREQIQSRPSPPESHSSASSAKEKFELFGLGWAHHSRDRLTPLSP